MTKHTPLPPLERLNELFEIVPIAESQLKIQSGLVWKVKRRGTRGIGSVAGTKQPHSKTPGRFDWRVGVDGSYYFVSRLIYFMATSEDPGELEVDHKDRNPMNNNFGNLRLGVELVQENNRGTLSSNTSGAVGVSPLKNGKWRAQLWHKGEHFHLGCYTCLIEAARVVNNKIIELELDKIGKPLNNLEATGCDCPQCCNK